MNQNEKGLSSKQLLRLENKKKKMAALVKIAKLNEADAHAKKNDIFNSDSIGPTIKKQKKTHSNVDDSLLGDQSLLADSIINERFLDSTPIENYEDLKAEVTEIKLRRKSNPQFRLKIPGNQASLSTHVDDRVPILLTDIQHLLLYSILTDQSPYLPSRWCLIEKPSRITHTAVLVIDGLSLYHFVSNESFFTNIIKHFQNQLEVVTPSLYGGSIVDELAVVPLTDIEKDSLVKQYGSMDSAMESRKDLMVMMKAVFPVVEGMRPKSINDEQLQDKFSRTQLMLSAWQLVDENYPLPLKGKLKSSYCRYVMTKDTYEPVTATSPMFGLDCEMCRTCVGSELTRVSVVNEKWEVVYESLVLPYNEILDYLTHYSGITYELLAPVTTRLEDVQRDLRKLLPPDAILVGQSLNCDLHALKMMHPYVIDTSVIFNMTGQRMRKSKLKLLTKEFLKTDIQDKELGHCSVEDSLASLKLVQLKLSKNINFGDAVLKGREKLSEKYDHLKSTDTEYTTNIFNQVAQQKKSSVIVGCDTTIDNYSNYHQKVNKERLDGTLVKKKSMKLIKCDGNVSVVENTCKLVSEHNLTISHLEIDQKNLKPKVFSSLAKWIDEVWSNLPARSLMSVIFSGDKNCNGVSFFDIKK